jgi:hypothetical protein
MLQTVSVRRGSVEERSEIAIVDLVVAKPQHRRVAGRAQEAR